MLIIAITQQCTLLTTPAQHSHISNDKASTKQT